MGTTMDGALSRRGALDEQTLSAGREVSLALAMATAFGAACAVGGPLATAPVAALLVPCSLLAVAIVSIPSLSIGLALAGYAVDPAVSFRAGLRGVVEAGRTLGGLAPLMLLYRATSPSAMVPMALASWGMGIAGIIGIAHLVTALSRGTLVGHVRGATALVVVTGASVFALVLGLRLWIELAVGLFFDRAAF